MDVRKASRLFLRVAAGLITLCLIGLGSVNVVADPHHVFASLQGKGVAEPLGYISRWRTSSAYVVRTVRPQALILGNSRSSAGYRPQHPGFAGMRAYNSSFPDATPYELLRYYEHANQVNPVEVVFWGMDLDNINRPLETVGDFSESRLSISRNGRPNAIDFDDLVALALQYRWLPGFREQDSRDGPHLDRSGRWVDFQTSTLGSGKPQEREEERWSNQAASEMKLLSRLDPAYVADYVSVLVEFLEVAARNGTRVRIAFNPTHMIQRHLIEKSAVDGLECSWKLLVVDKAAEFRRDHRLDVEVWDFSLAGRQTAEPIPDDLSQSTKGYYEFSHFTPELGDQVLSRVFSTPGFDPEFGVRLVPGDAVAMCLTSDRGYAEWKARNPQLIARVDRWIKP